MSYAIGKRSLAICDRCGQQYRYLELRKEWNGLRVCPDCFETKHPQLEPSPPPYEPQALQDPRTDRTEPLFVLVGEPVVQTDSFNACIGVGQVNGVTITIS